MPDDTRSNEELIEIVREGWRGTSAPDDALTGRISNADAALNELHERIKQMDELLVQANDTPQKLHEAHNKIKKLEEEKRGR
jgi:peptidoglycan hydrolase CwlO-like protein